jgi:hypothetical protein
VLLKLTCDALLHVVLFGVDVDETGEPAGVQVQRTAKCRNTNRLGTESDVWRPQTARRALSAKNDEMGTISGSASRSDQTQPREERENRGTAR